MKIKMYLTLSGKYVESAGDVKRAIFISHSDVLVDDLELRIGSIDVDVPDEIINRAIGSGVEAEIKELSARLAILKGKKERAA